MKELLEEFIHAFVKAEKQERLLGLLKKEKNWLKLLNHFHTSAIFETKVLVVIPSNEQYSEAIYSSMKRLGAEDECFSLLDFLGDRPYEWSLKDKLDDSVGFLYETVLYCPKAQIGYFEGGHAKDRCVLKGKS